MRWAIRPSSSPRLDRDQPDLEIKNIPTPHIEASKGATEDPSRPEESLVPDDFSPATLEVGG